MDSNIHHRPESREPAPAHSPQGLSALAVECQNVGEFGPLADSMLDRGCEALAARLMSDDEAERSYFAGLVYAACRSDFKSGLVEAESIASGPFFKTRMK